MIKANQIFLVLFILILNSCSDNEIIFPEGYENSTEEEETPDPIDTNSEVYFKFVGYEPTLYSDDWVIVHTSDGVLLDFKPYERKEELIFEAESQLITDKIAITIFNYEKYGNNHNLNIYTTLDVEKGAVWDEEPLEFQNIESPIIGDFDLILSDFPEIIGLNISNENTLYRYGYYSPTSMTRGKYTYELDEVSLYAENEYVISFNEDQTDFKYYFLDNVQNGDVHSISYDDFQFFDSYLDVNLPEGSYYQFTVKGLEDYHDINDLNGYTVEKAHYSEDGYKNEFLDRQPLRIGYLDRFNNFDTELIVYMNRFVYSYNKRGVKPTEIIIPDGLSVSVNDRSLESFDFDFNNEYERYISTWSAKEGTIDVDLLRFKWEVESTKEYEYFVGDLPEEFFRWYSIINIEALEYKNTEFVLNENEKILMR